MALTALASTDDLSVRDIGVTGNLPATLLAVASATVRRAAASPILATTSTVELVGWRHGKWLRLPGPPITAVASAAIDGAAVTDYRLAGGRLWRRCCWGIDDGPSVVTVTLSHGLPAVPPDIVDLVCSLVAAGAAAAAEGYAAHNGVVTEAIDDYSVTYAEGADAVATVMELPERTKSWLRSAFGGGVGSVRFL